jgi:hypothetical protein
MSDISVYLLWYLGIGVLMAIICCILPSGKEDDPPADVLVSLVLWPLILLAIVVMILTGKRGGK